jgi:hypothetical protein
MAALKRCATSIVLHVSRLDLLNTPLLDAAP